MAVRPRYERFRIAPSNCKGLTTGVARLHDPNMLRMIAVLSSAALVSILPPAGIDQAGSDSPMGAGGGRMMKLDYLNGISRT